MKVAWLSGNRGGGFVKLSLAPFNSMTQATFDANLLKISCFGYDQRPHRESREQCNHPCNARAGCAFQSAVDDNERYDTSITIPYNLNGQYVLQLAAYSGISSTPIYSCASLNVIGGNPTLTCDAPSSVPSVSSCQNYGPFSLQSISNGLQAGSFCYAPNSAGSIDQDIAAVPINADCDGRSSCHIAKNYTLCQSDITQTIIDPYGLPHEAGCTLTATPPTPYTAAPSATAASSGISMDFKKLHRLENYSSQFVDQLKRELARKKGEVNNKQILEGLKVSLDLRPTKRHLDYIVAIAIMTLNIPNSDRKRKQAMEVEKLALNFLSKLIDIQAVISPFFFNSSID
ncbi:hypothetical protein HDV06_000222 [Boothiomyces sp. JEL0866]|nr:hypothetical protein HDV06_000222 [Boothiomyces sp. JEL0866]